MAPINQFKKTSDGLYSTDTSFALMFVLMYRQDLIFFMDYWCEIEKNIGNK